MTRDSFSRSRHLIIFLFNFCPCFPLTFFSIFLSAYNHSCAKDNGGCSHLCLINPIGYSCVCPGGPCQTTSTSSISTTSSANRVTVTSSSTSTHITLSSKETHTTVSVSSSSSIRSSVSSNLAAASSSTPDASMAISSTSSKVNSPTTHLSPTRTSLVNSVSTATSPITDYCFAHEPCENGGICQVDGLSYKCVCKEYFIGQHCSIDISKFLFYSMNLKLVNLIFRLFSKSSLN